MWEAGPFLTEDAATRQPFNVKASRPFVMLNSGKVNVSTSYMTIHQVFNLQHVRFQYNLSTGNGNSASDRSGNNDLRVDG